MIARCFVRGLAASAAVSFLSPLASAQQSSAVEWSVTPYLWFTDTSVDLRLRDQDLGSGELSFNELLDITEQSFMVAIEAGRGQWTALADVTHLTMSDTDERGPLTIASRNEQSFIDLAAVYWPAGIGSSLSFLAGIRASLFDDRYRFLLGDQQLGQRHSSNDYVDILLGIRHRLPIGDRWNLHTGGNLSFGDSEGTFVARVFFAYSIGTRDRYEALFGYQYKRAEFTAGDLQSDYTYGGPAAGFSFRF